MCRTMVVKRKRISLARDTEKSRLDEFIQISGSSLIDLPNRILVQILLALPTKSIVFCKSVCKKWRNLISNAQFAKLHFALAKPQLLVRTLDSIRISRTLYLVEPDVQDGPGFDLDCCSCRWKENDNSYCHIELDAKLKIPLRNAESVPKTQDDFDSKHKKRCLNLKPKDHKYKIVNSCNGLLCLSEPSRNDPIAVCNPVTGEFVDLPPSTCDDEDLNGGIDCGLGFSPKSGQYKVIRVYQRNTYVTRPENHYDTSFNYTNSFAVVHTLGTDSWRSVDHAPQSSYKLGFPTYLKGVLYGLYVRHGGRNYIISFNFDNEQFELLDLPPECWDTWRNMSMGVLRGDLCICDGSDLSMKIWVLKRFSTVKKFWKKLISMHCDWPYGLYQPIHYFNSGDLLMFRNNTSGLIYSNSNGFINKYLGLCGLKSRYEVIVHIPSFISLKDIVAENSNVEILNVNTRCGKLKLPGETKALFLEGQDELDGYLDHSSYEVEEDYWTKYLWRKH
ncbi:F-box protein At3g07870-like [Humulus lupulus]|uniref:F-box protein At3g07870-like n=1 Tax=Humulus lupulus TaxID=3486 RepID=UPI002B4185DD|nr:F-box protein At3g07870-like [Humulus lupulus]